MVRVVQAPNLEFKCSHCGATCQGEESDFKELHTMPPLWQVECGYCHLKCEVSLQPLVAKLVATKF